MTIIYFLICLILITLGSFTKSFNSAQFFIIPMGLIAILFQKFVHKEKIKDLGFKKCLVKQLGKAVAFPVLILMSIFLLDFVLGLIEIKPLSRVKNPFNGQMGVSLGELFFIIFLSALFTFIGSFITEELGFRGYLITRFRKLGDLKALLFSSILFGLWHIPPSIILLGSGAVRTGIYTLNIFLLGTLFGYLFLESKSLIPSSLFHGVWNALEYGLFGSGNVQAVFFGNSRTLFDPEEGLIGTGILLAFSLTLLWKVKIKKNQQSGQSINIS